jgi:hypothetical protein
MSVIIDVEWNNFKQFLREDKAFFYVENKKSFIMLKSFNNYFLRTIIIKEGTVQDYLFKDKELVSRGAISCKGFSFFEDVTKEKQRFEEVKVPSFDESE